MRTHAQLRAQLIWETTSERLRHDLHPDAARPCPTSDDLMASYLRAHQALEGLGQAFGLDVRLIRALDLVARDATTRTENLSKSSA
jgi:hypothetical protein